MVEQIKRLKLELNENKREIDFRPAKKTKVEKVNSTERINEGGESVDFFIPSNGKITGADYPGNNITEIGRKSIEVGETKIHFLFGFNESRIQTGYTKNPSYGLGWFGFITMSGTVSSKVLFQKKYNNAKDANKEIGKMFRGFKLR
jgi:hypothetical protein